MTAESKYELIECSTASELLDTLAPRGRLFAQYERGHWIFRGMNNADHGLVASALRTDEKSKSRFRRLARMAKPDWSDPRSQIKAEAAILEDFLWRADAEGLAVPEDSQALRDRLRDPLSDDSSSVNTDDPWPQREFWSLMALAQHYGLPTRLLDWTFDAFAAAYFAVRPGSDSDRVVVWALNVARLKATRQSAPYVRYGIPFDVVGAPGSGNPNLQAQHGVFTLWRPMATNEPDSKPLDVAIHDFLKKNRVSTTLDEEPMFYRITLPAREAGETLRLLAKEGVTPAKLFPGYKGIADAMHEVLHWNGPT